MASSKYTVRDLARDAGVSIATVSRYINQDYTSMSESTRKKLDELAEKNGYVNAKLKSPANIAVVIPDITDPFFAQIVEAVEKCSETYNYNVQLCLSQESFEREKQYIKKLIQQNVQGIVYMSTVNEEKNCYDMLKDAGKPFVVLDSYLSEYNVPALVFSNGVWGMYEATKHLIENGHTQIAYISGLRFHMFEHYRYQGYVNALLDSGLAVNPNLVKFVGFGMLDGVKCFRELMESKNKFTAVICENDVLAMGVYKVCAQMGLGIPEDLSIIGYNNTILSECAQPAMTSVDQHVDDMIQTAVDLLMKQIHNEPITDKIIRIAPSLVKRDSVKKIN